ncbi:MAG: glycosyltransferase family 2 protein [Flavobacterium sp.]|nr:MAG: glycosyltransferase family 2 protein [Flavobacterium sp.]
MEMAPIVLFAYNRPWHTEQTLQSLAKNVLASETELIVYVDGPKQDASAEQLANVEKVRELVKRQTWCKELTIHIAESNQGLANSIIRGVTETLKKHDRLIVLEDDMILSPYFLQYMNEALEKYADCEDVVSIHGYCVPINYSSPIFFLRGADCWGWATWKRGWKLFNPDAQFLMKELNEKKLLYDFDFNGGYQYTKMLQYQIEGKVDSWAIRWYASAYIQNKLTLYPSKSLVRNIGGDGSGTHVNDKHLSSGYLNNFKTPLPDIPIKESKEARLLIGQHYFKGLGVKHKLKKILKWGY